ncbi:MAG: hypothetical protein QOI11_1448 [Candidatus Eremiobacteraeota bacterium]|jgi:hypothetical protein|nr:hypothetical protein [Candidatus Eremiobacteraeota bacterium]
MDESTKRDLFTAVDGLARDLRLFRDVTESRFAVMGERFDRVEQALDQHGVALTELAADMASVQATLAEHGDKLERRKIDPRRS